MERCRSPVKESNKESKAVKLQAVRTLRTGKESIRTSFTNVRRWHEASLAVGSKTDYKQAEAWRQNGLLCGAS